MKRAYVLITPIAIADICKPSEKKTISTESKIPEDAVFITAEYSDHYQAFRLIFEHDSFEDIPEGNKIPMIESPIFTSYKEMSD